MSIPVEVVEELSYEKNIIGIKDSEYDEDRLKKSLSLWRQRSDFFHLTGVNKLMVDGILNGSDGIVPSTANFSPVVYRKLYELCLEGKKAAASVLLEHTQKLCDIYQEELSLSDSVAALKVVLEHLGFCSRTVLPPLMAATDEQAEEIINKYNNTIKDEIEV
jgi:4-hydroxy-tetrahydrodipicolinate synthase